MRRAARIQPIAVAPASGAPASPRASAPGRGVLGTALVMAVAALAATVMAMTWAGTAIADVFGPISLASESLVQQTEDAHDPAISGNGRYVAFDGSYSGVTGVWRRDLQTGEVQLVASDAQGKCENAVGESERVCYAELPSISADGRYVSFTTDEQMVPEDTNRGPDVYVRDMEPTESCELGEGEAPRPCAFTLASAADESTQGLRYEPAGEPGSEQLAFEEKSYGSVASGRSALSADGRRVAFVTTAVSDLDGPPTPALQVAVRDLQTHSTQLVSVAYDPATGGPATDPATGRPEPVSASEGSTVFGAVYAPNGSPPPAFRPPPAYGVASPLGASISADGSTVAWMGQDISEQAPVLSAETLPAHYTEPLWRRIADGPQAPTRRVTGGSDPAAPECAAGGETALAEPLTPADPCEGPFRSEPQSSGTSGIWTGGTGYPVPQLSENGLTVAFLAQAPTFAQGADFGQGVDSLPSDLFVADMAAGLTRVQALRRLTEVASANLSDPATTSAIVDLGISPDGSQVAFTTQRTSFPLGSPAYVSAPTAVPGMAELLDVDLSNETVTRVTRGFEGGAGEHPHPAAIAGRDPYTSTDGALSPSFSDDGDTLAFSSTASNLVYGDGNTPPTTASTTFDGSDAFVVSREVFGGAPAQQYVSPPPPDPLLAPAWRLGATAASRRDGSVLLDVTVPAAGSLRATAAAAVLALARSARTAHGGSHRPTRARVARRTVASTNGAAGAVGLVKLVLTLSPRYRALARQPGGLAGTVTIAFAAPGQPALRDSVPVTFQISGHSGRAAGARKRAHGRRARTGHR